MHDELFQAVDRSSNTSIESSVHDVHKLEKLLYYFNIRGDDQLGPRLVYRTSTDKFTPPEGPDNNPRTMRLLDVKDHAKLANNNLWDIIRDKVRDLLEA